MASRLLALWHWAAIWNWWSIATSGALSSLAKFGEHALGISLMSIATFGVISKMSHSKRMSDLSPSERRAWKGIGIVFVLAFFVYMAILISYNAMRDGSWSNLPKVTAYIHGIVSPPEVLVFKPPSPKYPPPPIPPSQLFSGDPERPLSEPPQLVFLYRDHRIEINNMDKMELKVWGDKLDQGPFSMDAKPTILPIQPFNYHINAESFEPEVLAKFGPNGDVRAPLQLFVEDSVGAKWTVTCELWAVVRSKAVTVEARNTGTKRGWPPGAASKSNSELTVTSGLDKLSLPKKDSFPIRVSLEHPKGLSVNVENPNDIVLEEIRWQLVAFRTRDSAFLSYNSQNIGYVKAHSKSANYSIELNAIPRATNAGELPAGGDVSIGDKLVGTLSVDCPICEGKTLVVSLIWGTSGWFYETSDGGKLLLPAAMTKEGVLRFIDGLEAATTDRHVIQ